ncbi:DUF3445 domain-containing protein [Erythrobacter jejuensis]|uniref:DUF3445 domain-containing protein n=2 Tax=Parerythrobacter jejuensis TaxID=795812 RepID=A0A845ASJ0_9SPHN|nr:DUF3445 domain-containing protein [Parerythrobacter jejuensis]
MGEKLKIGLKALSNDEWLQPNPDLAARHAAFKARDESIQLTEEAHASGAELAAMLGLSGGLAQAAHAHHEDMCLLTRRDDEEFYRLIGAAVAYPTDWRVEDKMRLPLAALHAPIQGYAEQLATGVDRFMAKLKPGPIYGRSNWFIAPTDNLCWIADGTPEQTFAHVTPENAGETLFVRSERQTLRRLPKTGSILFTIGVYVEPLGQLDVGQIAWLAQAMEGLLQGEGDRRGAPHYARALKSYYERISA